MSVDPAELVVAAPAKVNLFLHITGRRADGYHTLESLFALVDLADTIALRRRDDGVIGCHTRRMYQRHGAKRPQRCSRFKYSCSAQPHAVRLRSTSLRRRSRSTGASDA